MKTKSLLNLAFIALSAITTVSAQDYVGKSCGCPPVASRTSVNFSTLSDANGNLTATNTILDCSKTYILDNTNTVTTGKYFVGNGKSITIAPGTIIKGANETVPGTSRNGGVLTISRGAKIIAAGTESCPIVFTTVLDVNVDGTYGIANKGKWGGLVICGIAPNNLTSTGTPNNSTPAGNGRLGVPGTEGVGFIEGFTNVESRIYFGAGAGDATFTTPDPNDNSGILTYVSLRHGGEIIGAANELNGLTLGSVGRGTTIHHIEVVSNLDDGIEFFGGTVDLKYASVLFNDDDGFDWDLNWSGRGQFWVVIKTDPTTASGGDNGFEADGDDNKVGVGPYSDPTVYNATFIGSLGQNGTAYNPKNSALWGTGIMTKEQTKGIIRNCVIANYARGLDLKNDNARSGTNLDAYDNWISGDLKIECNTFVMNSADTATANTFLLVNGVKATTDTTKFFADQNVVLNSVGGFDFLYTMETGIGDDNTVSNTYDLIPAANLGTSCTAAPVDGFFTPANYRGAFEAGKKSWMSNYTLNALFDLENGLVPCPTDTNLDGTTNVTDFNAILGAFGTSCD